VLGPAHDGGGLASPGEGGEAYAAPANRTEFQSYSGLANPGNDKGACGKTEGLRNLCL